MLQVWSVIDIKNTEWWMLWLAIVTEITSDGFNYFNVKESIEYWEIIEYFWTIWSEYDIINKKWV